MCPALLPWLLLGLAAADGAGLEGPPQAPPSSGLDAALDEARAACRALDYDICAERALDVVADKRATDAQRFVAHGLAGEANRVMGKDVEARLSFRWILMRDPDAQLPPDTSPKIMTFFELVRGEVHDELAANGKILGALLDVETVPAGLEVFLGDQRLGKTPLTDARVPAGEHPLRIERGPTQTVELAIGTFDGGRTVVRAELDAAHAVSADELAAYDESVSTRDLLVTAGYVAMPVLCVAGCAAGLFTSVAWVFLNIDLSAAVAGMIALPLAGAVAAAAAGAASTVGWATRPAPPTGGAPVHRIEVRPPPGQGEPEVIELPADPVMPH